MPTPEEEARAKVYEPEVDGPRSAADSGANSELAGLAIEHEFYVKDDKLYVHGLQDCVVSAQEPPLRLWGEYICGDDKKREITKFKFESQHYMWEMKMTPEQNDSPTAKRTSSRSSKRTSSRTSRRTI